MKTKILKILVLMLLINMLFVRASIDASYECREKNCMEGTEIDFTVNIYNNINKSINIGDVYIKDRDYGTILGFDLSESVVLNKDEVRSFNFTSLVKEPVKGYTFYYVPCFKMSYADKPEEVFEICGKTVKSFTVLPLSKIECKEDSECEEDEYCNTFSIYKCRKLECEPNETALNHSCVPSEPKKVVIINWKNVILTAGFISLAVVLLFLFIRKKQRHEGEDYIDMTTEFGEEKESPKKEETDKKKEEKLDKEYKKIEESFRELKEDKPKKDEEKKEIQEEEVEKVEEIKEPEEKPAKEEKKEIKEVVEEEKKSEKVEEVKEEPEHEKDNKKEAKEDDKIKKEKAKPKNKKKYKRVKQNKTYEAVPDYIVDEQKEETKKNQKQETEDNNIKIMDYGGYEDEDEDKDVL